MLFERVQSPTRRSRLRLPASTAATAGASATSVGSELQRWCCVLVVGGSSLYVYIAWSTHDMSCVLGAELADLLVLQATVVARCTGVTAATAATVATPRSVRVAGSEAPTLFASARGLRH